MAIDPHAPADSVFQVDTEQELKLKNAFRVIGSFFVGLVTMGFGPAPSSQKFVVRLVETGDVLREAKWSEGEALLQDLGSLPSGEFVERWLQDSELSMQEG